MKIEKIEAIKTGKFGVEVEMYDIRRETAARIVSRYFGTEDTVNWEGTVYDKWICRDSHGRKWQFMRDSSITDSGNGGCEMVTPVLNYNDMTTLQEIIRILRHNGAKSDPAHDCGIHVHVDAESQNPVTIRNLVNLMKKYDQLILNAIGVDEQRRNWCKPVNPDFVMMLNNKKPVTMENLKKVWYESQGSSVYGANEHYNHTRYNILNLHSLWQGKGIEFRCFQFDNPTAGRKGGLHAGQLKAYIQLCLALCAASKAVKYTRYTSNDDQMVNPRRNMYCLMEIKLGMQGEEFKTARNLFIRNLEGAIRLNNVAA